MVVEIGVDEELLREARELTDISDTRELVEEGLRALIRSAESARRLDRRREAYLAALRAGATREEAQEHANRY